MLRPIDSTRRSITLLALAALGAAGWSGALGQTPDQPGAQPPAQPATPVAVAPLDISGHDFAGLRIATSVQSTDLALSASRAWMWTEDVPASRRLPAGSPGAPTQRLLLRGDARVDVGLYRFTASQAVVWIQRLGDSPTDPQKGLYQIAIYFDRVSDPGAQAGISQAGDRLLVTGILDGEIRVNKDAATLSRPVDPFLRESESRMARLLRQITGQPPLPPGPRTAEPGVDIQPEPAEPRLPAPPAGPPTAPIRPGVSRPFERDSPLAEREIPPLPAAAELPPAERLPPIFAERGILTIAAPSPTGEEGIKTVPEGEEHAAVFGSGIIVQYSETPSGRVLEITAERAVVFYEPGSGAEGGEFRGEAAKIRGIYLEGNVVATDGEYTLRGSRVYYDLRNNRATMIDAIFWTYDEQRRLPLYVRAKAIHQLARKQWSATDATVATTSFFEPHLSLGAMSITITQTQSAGGPWRTLMDARNITLRAGGVPFFYVPRVEGDVNNLPLRGVAVENSSRSGVALKTTWDMFTLLGLEHPKGFDAELLVDGYFDRGLALGAALDWENPTSKGNLFGYTIINDNGTDVLSSGARQPIDGETRGMIVGEHRWSLDDHWTAFLETSWVSDETFVDSFFRRFAQSRREFTNATYLRSISDNTEFSLLAKGEVNDFTPNQYLQQSPGYNTDKLPEAYYARLNDDLLAGAAPGLLSYSSEYRLSRLTLNFTEPTAAELGFDTIDRAREAFGLLPGESLGDRLRAAGLSESAVLRADTRQELSVPLKAGPVTLTPFVVGRATAYDRNFSEFSPDSTEQVRLWGAAGARFATTLQRINDEIDSRFFDLHRVRHIIEPSVTVWTSGTNLEQTDLPVYDDSVESIASGSAVRAGVTHTWQTQRGGAGRWHSVDVLRVSTDFVFSTSDADRESPIGHFFDWRPEYSLLGDYGMLDAAWQVSDAMALSFNTIYDFETHQPARTGTGIVVQHSEDFSTSAEARYINARDITLVDLSAVYRLTRKYQVSASVTFDTDLGEIQSVSGTVRRRFPQTTLGLSVRYNNISGDTSIGVVFEPAGVYAARDELRKRLGRESRGFSLGE